MVNLRVFGRMVRGGMNARQIKRLAGAIAERLFTNVQGEKGTRLVLVKEKGMGTAKVSNAQDLGGWCERAVVNVLRDFLDRNINANGGD